MSKVRKRRHPIKRTRRTWQLQEAKSHFSKLVNEVERDGYHTITKNGHPVVVVVSKNEFDKMRKPGNSLLDFFREAPYPDIELDIERDKDIGRDIDL